MAKPKPPPPPAGLTAASRNEWVAVWKRVRVQPEVDVTAWDGGKPVRITVAVKSTGIWAAEFANYDDGAEMFPGIVVLARVTGHAESTTGRSLDAIRRLGFSWQYVDGSKQGRRGVASEDRLTLPDDLLDRIPLLTPDLDVPDYHLRSEHLLSEHLLSEPNHMRSASESHALRAAHPSVPSTTTPHTGVAVSDSSVEGNANHFAPGQDRRLGESGALTRLADLEAMIRQPRARDSALGQRILAAIASNPGLNSEQLRALVHATRKTVLDRLRQLTADGDVDKIRSGRNVTYRVAS